MCVHRKIDTVIGMNYSGKKYVVFVKDVNIMSTLYQYTLKIPYGLRSQYYSTIQMLNNL